jgi:hypothetical protein
MSIVSGLLIVPRSAFTKNKRVIKEMPLIQKALASEWLPCQ